jgi:hypothetical protein
VFWRTYATAVVLFTVTSLAITAHESVSDRAVLTLQGTVSHSAEISIQHSDDDCIVQAVTNTPGGVALSVELTSDGDDSVLMIDGLPGRFENGCAHVADVLPGRGHQMEDGVAIAYAGTASTMLILDVAAR